MMMNPATKRFLAVALRCLLGLLLLWAAVSKLANPTAFLGSLYGYELPLPRTVLKAVAVAVPWTELLCGLLLLAGAWLDTALALLTAMLGVFALASAQAAWRGLEISCGCFDLSLLGFGDAAAGALRWIESPAFALVRNLGLLAGTLWLLRREMTGSGQGLYRAENPLDTRGSSGIKAPATGDRQQGVFRGSR